MKIAITSSGSSLESMVDPAFGRCAYFIIVDPKTMEWEAFPNPARSAGGGAGIQASQLVTNKGVEAMITGNIGPNAFQTLSAAKIKIFTGASGSVREAIESYKQGKLPQATSSNVPGHFGMGGGRGMGRRRW